jgi:hypothetical protein
MLYDGGNILNIQRPNLVATMSSFWPLVLGMPTPLGFYPTKNLWREWVFVSKMLIGRVFFARGMATHAKNGDELFWKDKFHVDNGKAQACTQGALALLLF